MVGATRFSDIHRGVPRKSRTLLAQRLKQRERAGIVERRQGPTYHLTRAGQELEPVVFGLGDWAKRWLVGDPEKDQLDGAQAMWRASRALVDDALPDRRTVVRFDFPGVLRGRAATGPCLPPLVRAQPLRVTPLLTGGAAAHRHLRWAGRHGQVERWPPLWMIRAIRPPRTRPRTARVEADFDSSSSVLVARRR